MRKSFVLLIFYSLFSQYLISQENDYLFINKVIYDTIFCSLKKIDDKQIVFENKDKSGLLLSISLDKVIAVEFTDETDKIIAVKPVLDTIVGQLKSVEVNKILFEQITNGQVKVHVFQINEVLACRLGGIKSSPYLDEQLQNYSYKRMNLDQFQNKIVGLSSRTLYVKSLSYEDRKLNITFKSPNNDELITTYVSEGIKYIKFAALKPSNYATGGKTLIITQDKSIIVGITKIDSNTLSFKMMNKENEINSFVNKDGLLLVMFNIKDCGTKEQKNYDYPKETYNELLFTGPEISLKVGYGLRLPKDKLDESMPESVKDNLNKTNYPFDLGCEIINFFSPYYGVGLTGDYSFRHVNFSYNSVQINADIDVSFIGLSLAFRAHEANTPMAFSLSPGFFLYSDELSLLDINASDNGKTLGLKAAIKLGFNNNKNYPFFELSGYLGKLNKYEAKINDTKIDVTDYPISLNRIQISLGISFR